MLGREVITELTERQPLPLLGLRGGGLEIRAHGISKDAAHGARVHRVVVVAGRRATAVVAVHDRGVGAPLALGVKRM